LAALHAKGIRNKDLRSGKCQAEVSQQTLADLLGCERRSIQYWLEALEKAKAIHITAERKLYNGTSILFYCHRKRLTFRVFLMSQKEQKAKNEEIPEGQPTL